MGSNPTMAGSGVATIPAGQPFSIGGKEYTAEEVRQLVAARRAIRSPRGQMASHEYLK
jgi:hypothetical protein